MSSANPFWLILLSLSFALLPVLVGVCTSYLKVSIVLSLLKNGLGAQGVPGALVNMTLSLGLTFYIMAPVFQKSLENGKLIDFTEFAKNPSFKTAASMAPIMDPWLDFMRKHAGRRELEVLAEISGSNATHAPRAEENQPTMQLVLPAFVLSELKEGFAMGFVMLLPFMAVDLIVANILAGLGMFMLSPMVISLPLKILLFVLCDGWILLGRGLISSYGV